MERGKDLTPAERTAMLQDIAASASEHLGFLHGDDREGLTDIEFRSMMHASAWLSDYSLWPVASNRDPIGGLYEPVVIQITLHDYAWRRGYMRPPVIHYEPPYTTLASVAMERPE